MDSFCAPFGRGDGKCTFLEIHIDMKSNSLGHFRRLEAFVGIGNIMPTIWGNISWWIIYVDNGYIMPTLGGPGGAPGMIVIWRVSLCPTGTQLGNVHF